MMIEGFIPCPKCGSEDGYLYNETVVHTIWIGLDGNRETEEPSPIGGHIGRIFRCINCESKFRGKTIIKNT